MECEEYRKVITADPSGGSLGQGAGHASDCEACRAYAAEIRALDTRIAQALSLDVPELEMPELPPIAGGGSTVVVDLESRGRRRLAAPAWLGLAAGIAAVLVFVVRQFETDDPDVVLAREVLAHMDHEQSSRRVTRIAVSDAALEDVLAGRVRAMDTGEAIVSYARSCIIDDHVVPHLVVQGRTGPITLIFMPDEDVDSVIPLNGRNVHGVILPAGTGSVAIIGQREQQMTEVGEVGDRIVETVKWSI